MQRPEKTCFSYHGTFKNDFDGIVSCPFPSSLHLLLIPSLVCLCIQSLFSLKSSSVHSVCLSVCLVPCYSSLVHCSPPLSPHVSRLVIFWFWFLASPFFSFELCLFFVLCLSFLVATLSFAFLTGFLCILDPLVFVFIQLFGTIKLAFCSPISCPLCVSAFESSACQNHNIKVTDTVCLLQNTHFHCTVTVF